jgi:hypothetical protein
MANAIDLRLFAGAQRTQNPDQLSVGYAKYRAKIYAK